MQLTGRKKTATKERDSASRVHRSEIVEKNGGSGGGGKKADRLYRSIAAHRPFVAHFLLLLFFGLLFRFSS